jgi:iron donor protein CyaY
MSAADMDEKTYRLLVKDVYARIEAAFEDVDPDLVEVEPGMGTLALVSGKNKTILSTQPSVRQIWLAVAALGIAVHFNYDSERGLWVDDKGEGKELFAFLSQTMSKLLPQLPPLTLGPGRYLT